MKQEIEEIIRKNLPERKEEMIFGTEDSEAYTFNQALSSIDPSLIADEVLKVVVEKIKDGIQKYVDKVKPIKIYVSSIPLNAIGDIISNLSPNKENKNNEK